MHCVLPAPYTPNKDELPDKPPRSRSEIRAWEVVGHGEREISHAQDMGSRAGDG